MKVALWVENIVNPSNWELMGFYLRQPDAVGLDETLPPKLLRWSKTQIIDSFKHAEKTGDVLVQMWVPSNNFAFLGSFAIHNWLFYYDFYSELATHVLHHWIDNSKGYTYTLYCWALIDKITKP